MDILAALSREEATEALRRYGTIGGKTRVISAAARAKISQASKERWAKFRATKAGAKQ
jgi:hypothetical protein